MSGEPSAFSIIRLNDQKNGWGVVDAGGAIVRMASKDDRPNLAMKLTKDAAKEMADLFNREAAFSEPDRRRDQS